jgi:small-conductance mechanosensitive channel
MEKRRVEFSIRLAYDTPLKKLKKIPEIIKKIIEKYDMVEFDNIHFTEFGNLGPNFQVVYYIKTGDYNKYLDIQQDINFAIMEAFDKEGIEMGYQTKPSLSPDK